MERYELASSQWIEKVHSFVRELMRDADLEGVEFSSSEEFLNPPAHIAINGRAGWHMKIENGTMLLGAGPLDTAERRLQVDYQSVKPLVPIRYDSDSDAQERVRAQAQALLEKGLLAVVGDRSPSSLFPQLAPLRDLVADITAL